jgi:hypothetical protein
MCLGDVVSILKQVSMQTKTEFEVIKPEIL